ncbi:STAS domain-containing protein [Micromonospora sp. PLK6-60]|uniref:STAS domain-containing protein n=1 Tax=Micromonospora sp. PLK6-60 TaxID=2873383 RepID=UPI001CA658B3|nr:STAS domain-containing protein [Micromonospora sp. PLK6-60]MBY8872338.1 STAS domain-containing protein [Micromonospora sp. PLK6-60]
MSTVAITFVLRGALGRADIPALCADLAEVLRDRGPGVVVCDVTAVACPDVVTVEALARLLLTARRHGWRLVVGSGGGGLRELIDLLGLADALGEPVRQPEQRKQPVGVEEAVDARDPPG